MPLGLQKLQMLLFYCVRFINFFVVQRDLFDFVDFIVFLKFMRLPRLFVTLLRTTNKI